MQLLLFTVVAICIAGSITQEIATGTDYLRAHSNDSLSFESATYGKKPAVLPAVGVVAVGDGATTAATTAAAKKGPAKAHDHSSEEDGHHKKGHHHHENETHPDHKVHHEDESEHEHETHANADLHIDLQPVLNLVLEQLHKTEERIVAAIHHSDHETTTASASAVPIVPIVAKSYRIAER